VAKLSARACRRLAALLLALAERLDPSPALTPEEVGRLAGETFRRSMQTLSAFLTALSAGQEPTP
jgi:hypothetical protein